MLIKNSFYKKHRSWVLLYFILSSLDVIINKTFPKRKKCLLIIFNVIKFLCNNRGLERRILIVNLSETEIVHVSQLNIQNILDRLTFKKYFIQKFPHPF